MPRHIRPAEHPLRRSPAEVAALDELIVEMVRIHQPATVRGIFYQVEVAGGVPKSEAGYRAVQRRLVALRDRGDVPYESITDGTRTMRKPQTFDGLGDMLDQQARFYRRTLFDAQDSHVEVWCEKDALTGVLYPVTSEWDVPLMPGRGFGSDTFLHGAASEIVDAAAAGKFASIYYVGDYDPSGVSAGATTEAKLRRFAAKIAKQLGEDGFDAECDIDFEWLAVTPAQIEAYDLPTRPTKRSDSRSVGFGDESVELDALPPNVLRELVAGAILRHIDPGELERLQLVEAAERETLDDWRSRLDEQAS